MAKLMVQGTASSVGKSILVTALCRIFKQDGYTVCPYKSQNMSLNSYITLDGKEMGRAQVLQAYAAGLEPEAYMNPILLKPTSDKNCQIIHKGEIYGYSNAKEYHNLKPVFKESLKRDFEDLEKRFDIIVIEGAGSPAEINLRENDIVNMGFAELIDAPVVLVGDIDKGGVFASLYGTIELLQKNEQERIKGTIINKFRGDVSLLQPGIDILEDITKKNCLGVVPYFVLDLEDEDGAVALNTEVKDKIDVAVVRLPHISNFTDLDALAMEKDISVRYIYSPEQFGNPDMLIIPGTKNTIGDLKFLKESGLFELIKGFGQQGRVLGICGGYQMLGRKLIDPHHVESESDEEEGLGLLPVDTEFTMDKRTTRVNGVIPEETIGNNRALNVYGYEIHMGTTKSYTEEKKLVNINQCNGKIYEMTEGNVNEKGNVIGTYLHGIFDGIEFRQHIANTLRRTKKLKERQSIAYESVRDKEIDRLADVVRKSLDMDKIYEVAGLGKRV